MATKPNIKGIMEVAPREMEQGVMHTPLIIKLVVVKSNVYDSHSSMMNIILTLVLLVANLANTKNAKNLKDNFFSNKQH